jgi:hypothetical protein
MTQWLIITASTVFALSCLVIWLRWLSFKSVNYVELQKGIITLRASKCTHSVRVNDLTTVEVVLDIITSPIEIWDFVDKSKNRLSVPIDAVGMESLLSSLESHLPGFSHAGARQLLRSAPELVDHITVWSSDLSQIA